MSRTWACLASSTQAALESLLHGQVQMEVEVRHLGAGISSLCERTELLERTDQLGPEALSDALTSVSARHEARFAELRETDPLDVAAQTEQNARELFRL